MSDWDDYLAAARRLDTVRREAASVADAGAARVRAEARDELTSVRQRLDRQRSLLLTLAGAPGPVAPAGAGTGSEAEPEAARQAAAGPAYGSGRRGEVVAGDRTAAAIESPDVAGSGSGVGAGSAIATGPLASTTAARTDAGVAAGLRALRAANAHLDAADAILSGLDRPGHAGNHPPVRRNALVYGSFAVVVLAAQLALFGTLKNTAASMAATAAGAVLPLVGFGLSWLLIGLVFGGRGRGAGRRLLGTARAPLGIPGGMLHAPVRALHGPVRALRGPVRGLRDPGRALRAHGRIRGDERRSGRPDVPNVDPGGPAPGTPPPGLTDPALTDPGPTDPGPTDPGPTGPGPTDPRLVAGDAVPGRVDRTPLLGAAISLAPVVVLCAGLGTAALLR